MLTQTLLLTVAVVLSAPSAFAADAKPTNAPATKPAAAKPPKKEGTKWDSMEHGPFLQSYMDATPKVNKALSINLGNGATVCFDTEMCKLALGWTGGFVKLPTGRDGLEGMPKPGGSNIVFTTPAGPGWADKDGNFSDGRPEFKGKKYGPLPKEHAKWKGVYLDGDTAVLSYTVGKASVLEKDSFDPQTETFSRVFILSGDTPLTTILCEAKGEATIQGATVLVKQNEQVIQIRKHGEATFELGTNKTILLKIAKAGPVQVNIQRMSSEAYAKQLKTRGAFGDRLEQFVVKMPNLKGGAPRWGAPISVPGKLSTNTTEAYVVDTLTVPENNPFNSWIRCSGLDFFADGTRAAVCSVSGDVWLISNIDDKLDRVTWQRFATGLFQPLGLKIVDDLVYVLGRDQITRLHDLNKDGEADFYENFNNDVGAFQEYHEFAHDLQVDSHGDFFFAKGGNLGDAKHPHNGSIIKVSKDGSKLETVANGLRAPNGMGMGPHDEISVSDNQGNWVPASRFSIIKPGGFYGHVNNAFKTPKPTSYDNPVCWIPHPYPDNSSGGQVWVTSDKWGPFKDDMLFMSYGQCLLFKVLLDKVDGEYQGGVVKFQLKFDSGVMRARFNQKDGQLYVTGLSVWQSNAAKKGAVHRVRYTGKPLNMPTKLRATKQGVELTFTSPLDEASVADLANWNVEEWDYKWSSDYGSPEFKHSMIANREAFEKAGTSIPIQLEVPPAQAKGHDKVEVKSVKLSADRKTLLLEMPNIHPVMQMKITANIKAADGTPIKQDVWNSIYKLAEK